MKSKAKVVILCGGRGSRLKEATEVRPKPLLEIGSKPILWHIMKTYSFYGFNDFIICLGYKGSMIKEYFLNYGIMNNDFSINLGHKDKIEFHTKHMEKDWNITLVDTGSEAQTGARIKRIEKYIKEDNFLVTYGDGIANVNIKDVWNFSQEQGKIGVVTGVYPSSRFGELIIEGDKVVAFSEKPQTTKGFINGGFFVFKREFFNYLKDDDSCYLEREPLEKLSQGGQLSVYKHEGFWQCMDTLREWDLLNSLWHQKKAPWKVW